MYMVPPFLAYYGVTVQNISLLQEACTQISLYRNYLRDTTANGLWKHIQLGSYGADNGHWSTGDPFLLPSQVQLTNLTGNAWAAAGMIRVLGTIQKSQYADLLITQQKNLAAWIQEIHNGMYSHLVCSPALNRRMIADQFPTGHQPWLVPQLCGQLLDLLGCVVHGASCKHRLPLVLIVGRAYTPPNGRSIEDAFVRACQRFRMVSLYGGWVANTRRRSLLVP